MKAKRYMSMTTLNKSTRKITPIARGNTNGTKFVVSDPLNVIATRKLTRVTVSIMIPIYISTKRATTY